MSAGAPPALSPQRRRLGNGLTLLAQRTRMHSAVTIALAIPAGSVADPPEGEGLAHFVSRVVDRGTRTRSSAAIADALDDRGVSLGAGISRHHFFLSCSCLTEDAAALLQLMAEIVRDPVFPPREVETRRSEIITAIRQDADNPAAVAGDTLLQLLFEHHPYGRRTKGSLETVHSIAREHLVEFHRTYFGPAVTTIAVVGDIEPAEAADLVEQGFGGWRAGTTSSPRVPAASAPEERKRIVIPMMGKAQADVAYGFPGICRDDPGYYAALLMNHVFGQHGLGGRLGDSIRERQGMAYYAYSSLDADLAAGSLTIRAGVSGEHVDSVIASIDAEVDRLLRDGITADELTDARRYLIGSMPRVLETNEGIASFLLTTEHFGLGLDHQCRLPGLLDAVTLDEVNAAAARLLRTERAAIAVAGPCAERPAGRAA